MPEECIVGTSGNGCWVKNCAEILPHSHRIDKEGRPAGVVLHEFDPRVQALKAEITAKVVEVAKVVKDLGEGKPGQGVRMDPANKPRFDLIPGRPLFFIAQVYQFGALKYRDRNWELGMPWSWHFAAMMRHAWRFWMGTETDGCPTGGVDCKPLPEWKLSGCRTHSGLPHLAHAAWACLALLEYMTTYRKGDDRSTTIIAKGEPIRKEGV